MGRRKNDEIINSQLMEVDIYANEDEPIETIGQRIRRIRIAKGLTQDDLAKLMGYSNRYTINKIESGAHNIDHEKNLKFAYILKVPARYLLTGEKNYKTNRMILTTIEDCVHSCELNEGQMQIALDLMHVFMKENELKEKTKKCLIKQVEKNNSEIPNMLTLKNCKFSKLEINIYL